MKKKIVEPVHLHLFSISFLAIIILLWLYVFPHTKPEPITSFTIEGTTIPLQMKSYEYETAPGSASKTRVAYFGNEVRGDFDGDGKEDRAFLVTRTTGGSGTFFYLVTSLGGEAALLGDRIAPQTTEYRNGYIIVNYAERKTGEPMTARPSVGVSKYFKIKNGILTEME